MLLEKKIKQRFQNDSNSAESPGFNFGLLFEQIAFYGLLVTILFAAVPHGTVDPTFKSLFVFLTCIAATFRILEAIVNGSLLFADFRLLAPLIAILLLAIIQILPFNNLINLIGGAPRTTNSISFDPFETKDFILTFLGLILTAEILLRYTNSRRRLAILIYLVFAIGIGSALYGFARHFFSAENPDVSDSGRYAQFINKNHFAFLMEMSLGLLLGLLLKAKLSQKLNLFFFAMLGIACFSIIAVNSRGGILSSVGLSVVAVFVYFLTKNLRFNVPQNEELPNSMSGLKATLTAFFFASLLFAASVFIISAIGGDPVVNRIETIQSETVKGEETKGRRREFWQATIELIKANPITGIGFGAYPAAITEYDKSTGQFYLQQAHNDYLELLADGGIAAFLLMLTFAAIFVKRIRRQFASADRLRQASCFGAAIGLLGVMFHSMVDFSLHTIINSLVAVVLIVIAAVDIDPTNKTGVK